MSNSPQPGNTIQTSEDLRRKQNAIRISYVLTIAYLAAGALYAYLAFKAPSWQLYGLIGIMAALLASSLGATGLIRRDRMVQGAFLMIGAIALGFPLAMVLESGLGLTLGIATIMGISLISRLSLKQPYEVRALGIAIVSAVTTILLDFFLSIDRPSFPLILTYIPVIAAVAIGLFIVFIARELPNYTLRTKLILAFVLITLVPLVVLGYLANTRTRDILYQNSTANLNQSANLLTAQVDTFINNELLELYIEAQNDRFIQYLSLPSAERPGSEFETSARAALAVLLRKNNTQSYALIDVNGQNVLDTVEQNIGRNENGYDYFKRTVSTGGPVVSGLVFNQQTGQASLFFSAPVRNENGDFIGMLRVEYKASAIQSIVNSTIASQGKGFLIMIVDQGTYVRIAYTGAIDELYKSLKNFSAAEIATFQTQGRMLPGAPADVLDLSDEFTKGLDNLKTTPVFTAYSADLGDVGTSAGAFSKSVPWMVVVIESQKAILDPINTQTRIIVLISLGLIAFAAVLAYWISSLLASPINNLASVAEKVAGGDLSARARITTEDEVGHLAVSFNRMTDELNLTLNSLEKRIAERTGDLEAAQLQSEKRADQLQAISEISKIVTGEQKLDILLPLITRLVSERLGFYHTGIFLVEETKQFAVLQAANSEGGRRMLARGHQLKLGYGLVGYVAQTGIYRIALDVGSDSVYFDNPDLPTTRSEMALPLKIRNQNIGVLDVQSEMPNAFTENDARTLSILTDQISIALENARLFERTQQALNEMQTLYRQNLQENWAAFTLEESQVGYHQTMKGGTKLKEPVESDEIRQAVNRGTTLFFSGNGDTQEPSVIVPIKLRGQVIGTLKIKAPARDRQWTNDEVNLVETISERLSIALENARLIQESQRQVIKQQTIRDMTEKISTSINLKNVLQIAVEELGRVIPGSEVILKLTSNDDQGKQS